MNSAIELEGRIRRGDFGGIKERMPSDAQWPNSGMTTVIVFARE